MIPIHQTSRIVLAGKRHLHTTLAALTKSLFLMKYLFHRKVSTESNTLSYGFLSLRRVHYKWLSEVLSWECEEEYTSPSTNTGKT